MAASQAYVAARPVLKINGTENPSLGQSLLDCIVRAPENGLTSTELRFVNWGEQGSGRTGFLFDTLSLGDKITLDLGLAQRRTVFSGDITGLEERYGDGAPQLVVLAEDALHRMARTRKSRVFEGLSPNAIVSSIASEASLTADVRLSDTAGTYAQLNESNLHFVRRLAQRYAAQPRISDGKLVCRSRAPLPTPVRLDAGDTLKRLRVTADLARQPTSSVVQGIDIAAGTPIRAAASALAVAASGTTAKQLIDRLGWEGTETAAFPPPSSSGDATDYANACFDAKARRFLYGDLVCSGSPDIVIGAAVELGGVSRRLAGRYAVIACAHVFDESAGYQTYARVERADSA